MTEPLDLDALRALTDAATDGPWRIDLGSAWRITSESDVCVAYYLTERDAAFIAAARTAVPALAETALAALAEVERLRGPFPCCPHCADDTIHDVEPDQHTLPCSLCDETLDAAVARAEAAEAERDALREQVEFLAPFVEANDGLGQALVEERAKVTAVLALCDEAYADHDYPLVPAAALHRALTAAQNAPAPTPTALPRYVCGDCGYIWPRGVLGPPLGAKTCPPCGGRFTQVPHAPSATDCIDCRAYPLGCAAHRAPAPTSTTTED